MTTDYPYGFSDAGLSEDEYYNDYDILDVLDLELDSDH